MINFGKFNNLTKVSSNISTMQTFISTFGELWGGDFLTYGWGGGTPYGGKALWRGEMTPKDTMFCSQLDELKSIDILSTSTLFARAGKGQVCLLDKHIPNMQDVSTNQGHQPIQPPLYVLGKLYALRASSLHQELTKWFIISSLFPLTKLMTFSQT